MKKHAYLIMAYNNWDQLSLLISLIDDPRNDIFIHIDKRSGEFPKDKLEAAKAKAAALDNRIAELKENL